ncbi:MULTISPECIES: transposase [unclassified Sulfuricurvum]|uniref:transposase n=1 Tax=unclassified Sulfuricurvum TaxID=2632390 RepID=UPI0025CF01AF|nr:MULTISPECIES: transposase [unclassified Sulfuricurvum]
MVLGLIDATMIGMEPIEQCVYCHHRLYRLSDGMVKCPSCRKKYSLQKIRTDLSVITAFCDGASASAAARALRLNYITVKKRYDLLRTLITEHLETRYQNRAEAIGEYEEYIYLEAAKRHDQRHIFDAHNFITFDYGGWIYTLMMPSLHRYKHQFLEDNLHDAYYQEFTKFLRLNRIAKLQKQNNQITKFWGFFESFILSYRGVESEHFIYYLKEAEFKFNYPEAERHDVLRRLWLEAKD